MSGMQVTALALRVTAWVMPRGRRGWARAMAAEAPCFPTPAERLAFVIACLGVACRERSVHELCHSRAELSVGAAAGAIFLLHAFIPDSRSWPWLWPALCGVLVSFVMRDRSIQRHWTPVVAGLKAGLVCALLFMAGGAAALGVAALDAEASVIWRGAGLLTYGAIGALLLTPVTAAAGSVIIDRFR